MESNNNLNDLRKDSFSDRFCDDFTEVIISFLPIDGKLRFESVSKQFQSLIFNKQYVLNIDFFNDSNNNNLKPLFKLVNNSDDFHFVFDIDSHLLSKVLKKFKFINEISFCQPNDDIFIFEIRNINDVFNQISDNCKNLKTLTLPHNCPTLQCTEYFGQSLGHQLIKLQFGTENRMKLKRLLRFVPNLKSLTDVNIGDLIQNQEIQTKQLRSLLKLHVYEYSKDLPLYKIFVSHFAQQLTHLDIDFILDSDEEEIELLQVLDQFKVLKTLRISSNCEETYSPLLTKVFKSIANNCKQLKCFEFNTIFRNSFDSKMFCQSFVEFNGLKEFSFGYFKNESGEFDFNCLKNCKQLTHLKLGLMRINDHCFQGFESIFPNLKSLKLKNENKLSEQTMDSFKKIKSLKVIQIINRNYNNI